MQSYAVRHASFTPPHRSKSSSKAAADFRWPHPDSYLATPASLAAAGFYFNAASATPDAVSCFICDKGLADWDPDDDPAQIHAAKCPKCPWALLKCVTDTDDDGSFNFASPSRLPTSRPMEKARLATFGPDAKKWWPHDAKNKGPTSKTMAKAGFMYAPAGPKDDTCMCIYCGIELSGWQPDDDPMEEHRSRQAKNGPCPFFTYAADAAFGPGPAPNKQRARTKSKPPATPAATAAASASDEDYQPPGTRSSTRAPPASTNSKKPGGSTKSKSSKKAAKAKTIDEEVVEEYHVALDEDEDAPPKPRPKPRRTASRATSRASSRSHASSAQYTTADESESAVSSKFESKHGHESGHDPLPPSSSSSKKSSSKPLSSKKRAESEETQRSTRSRSRPPPSQEGHARVVSKSKAAAKSKGKGKVDDEEVGVEEPEKLSRVRKGKGKTVEIEEEPQPEPEPHRGRSKAKAMVVETEEEPQPEPEPPRGRTKAKAKVVESTEEEDAEPVLGKPNGRPKAGDDEAGPEPGPSRERSKGKTKAVPRDAVGAEKEAQPKANPEAQPQLPVASRRSKPSNGKVKPPAEPAVAPVEEERPAPEPARERTKTKTKPPSKTKQEVQPLPEANKDLLQLKPEKPARSKPAPAPAPPRQPPQPNGIHHAPQPIPRTPFRSFQSPEDEEFAREEEALEEQARELMLADETLTLAATPLSKGKGRTGDEDAMPGASLGPPVDKGKGKAEFAMDVDPAPSTPPPPQRGTTTIKAVPPSTVKFPQLIPDDTLTELTDEERAMTVEQWVRHEMDRQYERLRSDGRQKIDAFKARSEEVARQIESL